MWGARDWDAVMFSNSNLLPVFVKYAKAAAPTAVVIATALRFFFCAGFSGLLEDQIRHAGVFILGNDSLLQKIPVEIIQPQFFSHSTLPLAVRYSIFHAVTPFCIYCPQRKGRLFLRDEKNIRRRKDTSVPSAVSIA